MLLPPPTLLPAPLVEERRVGRGGGGWDRRRWGWEEGVWGRGRGTMGEVTMGPVGRKGGEEKGGSRGCFGKIGVHCNRQNTATHDSLLSNKQQVVDKVFYM